MGHHHGALFWVFPSEGDHLFAQFGSSVRWVNDDADIQQFLHQFMAPGRQPRGSLILGAETTAAASQFVTREEIHTTARLVRIEMWHHHHADSAFV